ncbi:MAG TPA: histidine kinase [Actinospica sp.]|jgi:signal transduction histidine kinase|nr:histidine kinase [Actinospica sp.]
MINVFGRKSPVMAAWQRALRDHAFALDAVLALVLFGVSFPGTRISAPGAAAEDQWWPGVLLTGLGAVCLLWRRSRPRTVAVLTGVAGIAVAALGYLPSIFVLGPLVVALYTLAERSERKVANSIAFTMVVLVAIASVAAHPDQSLDITLIAPAASLLLPLSLGTTVRVRRAYIQSVHARAQYAEQTREQEARQRVAEERVRIARELHDVVAHHLALANAQAGAVAHIMRTKPEQAEKLVAELAATTSSALRELKGTVGLLRAADETDAPLQPAPGLAQLPELAAAVGATGLEVTVTTEGRARPLSPGADLTAYRIIQEALTNVTKHAATREARVLLRYAFDRLTLTVTNEARRPAAPAPDAHNTGFGLIGMRERAQSVGGVVRTGLRPDGVFEVTADLPLYDPEPEEEAPSP